MIKRSNSWNKGTKIQSLYVNCLNWITHRLTPDETLSKCTAPTYWKRSLILERRDLVIHWQYMYASHAACPTKKSTTLWYEDVSFLTWTEWPTLRFGWVFVETKEDGSDHYTNKFEFIVYMHSKWPQVPLKIYLIPVEKCCTWLEKRQLSLVYIHRISIYNYEKGLFVFLLDCWTMLAKGLISTVLRDLLTPYKYGNAFEIGISIRVIAVLKTEYESSMAVVYCGIKITGINWISVARVTS